MSFDDSQVEIADFTANQVLPEGTVLPLSTMRPKLECFQVDKPPKMFSDWQNTPTELTEWLPAQQVATGSGTGSKIIFIMHGFMNNVHDGWMESMKNAILKQEASTRVLVVLVGWGGGADKMFYQYNTSVVSLPVVSQWLAPTLKKVRKLYPDVYLHGIGHSLGAHGLGMAGQISDAFNRISGLDPAGPHFEKEDEKSARLKPTDAAIVDVIHTDGYKTTGFTVHLPFGTLLPLGTVDFYVNYGIPRQPGVGWTEIAGSHARAHELYTWSVTNPGVFNTNKILDGNPDPDHVITKNKPCDCTREMGYHVKQPEQHDNFYVETNDQPPWAPVR